VSQPNVNQQYEILHAFLDLGEAMLLSGIEINRVESSLARLGTSFGACNTEILISNAGIVGTLIFPDGQRTTQTRRIRETVGVNCSMAERLEALIDDCCLNPVPIEQFKQRLKEACTAKEPAWTIIVGSVLAMMSFTILFGGDAADSVAAGLIGLLVALSKSKLMKFFPNPLVYNTVASFVIGLIACTVCAFIPTLHLSTIMTGAILVMIPGLAFTHALRDVFKGETVIGATHFVETLLWAFGLAIGFVSAMEFTEVYAAHMLSTERDVVGTLVCLVAAYTGSLGFSMTFRLPRRLLLIAPLGALLAYGAKLLTGMYFEEAFIPSFIVGVVAAIFAIIMSRRFKTTPMAFAVPSVMPCLPGSAMFYALGYAVAGNYDVAGTYVTLMMVIAVSVSAGLCMVWAVEATIEKIKQTRQTSV